MKNKVKIGIVSVLVCAVLWVIVSTLLPIDFDAITGSAEFKNTISDHYIADLDQLVHKELGEGYQISSTAEDIAKTIEWDGKTISCNALFVVHGEVMSDVVMIHFKGTKYWYKKYKWKIVD